MQSGLTLDRNDTAIVFIDPQNDVLSEKGAAWGAVGASVLENKTVENMERIFQAAKQKGFEVFISVSLTIVDTVGFGAKASDRFRSGACSDLSQKFSAVAQAIQFPSHARRPLVVRRPEVRELV